MESANHLKKAFREGRQTFGGWQMLPGANLSRIIARSGVDWVVVDCEHGNIDDGEMHDLVPAIAAAGVSPLVRIPDIQAWMVKRALDTGAHGIVVPLIRTVQEAKMIVEAAKIAPLGRRGLGSPLPMERFNPMPTPTEYLMQANDSLLTILQIETREAYQNVDAIAAVEGVDALFIGPMDLANDLGEQLQVETGGMGPKTRQAVQDILIAARKAGKKCGIYCVNAQQAKAAAQQGFDMVVVFSDILTLTVTLTMECKTARA